MNYTYIIQSINYNRFYIGQTSELNERLNRHNQGRSKYTKKYAPFRLIAAIPHESRSEACQLEAKLKGMKNPEKLLRHLEIHFSEYFKNEMI